MYNFLDLLKHTNKLQDRIKLMKKTLEDASVLLDAVDNLSSDAYCECNGLSPLADTLRASLEKATEGL